LRELAGVEAPSRHLVSAFEHDNVEPGGDVCEVTEGDESLDLLGELRSDEHERELCTIEDLEGVADADGDEILRATALEGERRGVRDVAERAEGLEHAHHGCN